MALRPMMRALDDEKARFDPDRAARDALDAVVGTDAGQIAVAPGRLLRSWIEHPSTGSGQGGRRYFHYATDVPIRRTHPVRGKG